MNVFVDTIEYPRNRNDCVQTYTYINEGKVCPWAALVLKVLVNSILMGVNNLIILSRYLRIINRRLLKREYTKLKSNINKRKDFNAIYPTMRHELT